MTTNDAADRAVARRRALRRRGLAWRSVLSTFGVSPQHFVYAVMGLPRFVRDWTRYRMDSRRSRHPIPMGALYPVLTDYRETAGTAQGHYFHQDLWAARRIHDAAPATHLDVGSRIDGFVSHVLAFMPVDIVDVRPLSSDVEGLGFVQCDATTMSAWRDGSIESLSSLHAVEHFGLGRYGDPVNPDGPFDAMASFARVLRPGGRLYFSVPVGRERVEYNAHRIFSPGTILTTFSAAGLTLLRFCAVDDAGRFVADADPADFEGADYSCGLFEFTKGAPACAPR